MDANVALLWMGTLGAATMLFRTIRMLRTHKGWLILSVALLCLDGLCYVSLPADAGYIAAAAWALFILTPSILDRQLNRLTLRGDYRQAVWPARLLGWLHPADGLTHYATFMEGLALQKEGQVDAARTCLLALAQKTSPLAGAAWVHLCRIESRWPDLVAQYRMALAAPADPTTALMYVRALGETGDLGAMVDLFGRVHQSGMQGLYPTGHLTLLAFCGQVEAVERLLTGPLSDLPQESADFWRVTALATAGQVQQADALCQTLQTSTDPILQNIMLYRRAHPVTATSLDLQHHPVVRATLQDTEQESRYGAILESRGHRKVILWLMAANLAVFFLELVSGGATNDETLIRLGALVPALVLKGEVWRLLAAAFLHAGWLHIASNLFGLYLLGPFVESNLGSARCLLLYLLSGVGANALYVLLSNGRPDDVLVGASGAIMGLAGASAAIVLKGWRRENSATARRGLGNIALLMVIQVVFDFNVPGVSSLCHMLGLALGLVLGLAMSRNSTANAHVAQR